MGLISESIVRGLSKGDEIEAGHAIEKADEFLKKVQKETPRKKKYEPRDNTGERY